MGKRVAVVYVLVIAAVSLLLGIVANYLYGCTAIDITNWIRPAAFEKESFFNPVCAVILVALILKSKVPQFAKK